MSQTVADIIAINLEAAGIDTVFGLPGGENVAVIDALARRNIRFVLVHNESSAVYMADVYGQVKHTFGVALTTLGPGILNAMAGLGHAFLDRSKVLLISASMDDSLRPHHTHQYVDQTKVAKPIAKWVETLTPANVCAALPKAITHIHDQRPGPVYLQVSKQMAVANVPAVNVAPYVSTLVKRPSSTKTRQARQLIANAKRPVIVVGLGINSVDHAPQVFAALQYLAEQLGAPVIASPKAKGCLPSDHPLFAGTLGLMRNDPTYELLAEADSYLAVGFDVGELVRPWDEDGTLLWISQWKNIDPVLPTDVDVVGDLAMALESIVEVEGYSSAEGWGAARVARFRRDHLQPPVTTPIAGRMWPQTVLQAIRDNTPRNAFMATDVGAHKGLTALTWPALEPNTYFVSNGLSAMGFGVPAALAAAMAQPEAPSIAVVGDGGMAMMVGELAMVVKADQCVIIVVMVDSALDLIRSAQRKSEFAVNGTEFVTPDFVKIAEAYGLAARDVQDYEECAAAVSEAVASGKPMLIAAHIDPRSYPSQPGGGVL